MMRFGRRGGPRGADAISTVMQGLLVSAAPTDRAYQRLLRGGVTQVVDLRVPSEIAPSRHPRSATSVPVRDGDAPAPEALDQLARQIVAWIKAGETVLVHCRAGVGRSATVACAVLITMGYSLSDAFRLVRDARPSISPTPAQLDALTAFERRIAERS